MATIKAFVVSRGLMEDEPAFREWLRAYAVDGFWHEVTDNPITGEVLIEVMVDGDVR